MNGKIQNIEITLDSDMTRKLNKIELIPIIQNYIKYILTWA